MSISVVAPALAAPEIREFSAAGQDIVIDDDDDFPDWVELYNPEDEPYALSDHFLTDELDDLSKWQFPRGRTIAGGKRSLVYASGKDRVNIFADAVHTNFNLPTSGGFLALVAPDGETIIDQWQDYPKQRPRVSYGRGEGATVGYFTEPSPGEANGVALSEVVKDTKFSVNRGFYEEAFSLSITSATEGAEIYYTLDGSEPSASEGERYTEPIAIAASTVVRAIAVKDGLVPTNIDTQTYLFVESVLTQPEAPEGFPTRWGPVSADYAFDRSLGSDEAFREALLGYPTVSLVMPLDSWFDPSRVEGEGGIYANSLEKGLGWERTVSAEFLNFEGSADAQVDCGIRIYGNASRQASRPKHNMRLAFRARYGPSKLDFPVFGEGKATGINGLLFNGQNGDSWFHPAAGQRTAASYIRDHFAHELLGDMGHVTPPQSRAHVYVNGLYWGFYQTIERVDQHFMARLFGGEPEEYDSMKASIQEGPTLVAGNTRAYEKLYEIANAGVETAEGYAEIQKYLDLDSYIDYMLINFWTGNRDWDGNNWRSGRHRSEGSPWHYVMWDSENIFKETTIDRTGANTANNPTRLHQQLSQNPKYRLKFADRVRRHLFNGGVLTEESVKERWRRWASYVRSGLLAESARWSDHHSGTAYTVDEDYREAFQRIMETIIPTRARLALQQFENRGLYPEDLLPVDFSQHGGSIEAGFALAMTAGTIFQPQSGDIVYTLDGSDPMDGGSVYTSPVTLAGSTTVKARVQTPSGEWSPLTEARFREGLAPQPGELVLSEIHYHPAKSTPVEDPEAQWSRTDFEFVELWNVSERVLQLEGVALTEGVRFTFPEVELRPNARILIVENAAAFRARYGQEVAYEFQGQLSNGGEQLALANAEGELLQSLTFDDTEPWPEVADGDGPSLTFHQPSQTWRPSALVGGSPGEPEGDAPVLRLLMTEVEGGYALTLTADGVVHLERSTNLADWLEAEEVPQVDAGAYRWVVTPASTSPTYFRVRVTPSRPPRLK